MVGKIGKYSIEKTDEGSLIVSVKSKEIKKITAHEGALMEVRGAWNLDQLMTKVVIELMDGSLETFDLASFKRITHRDLKEYKGSHPSKLKGHPLPEILYQYYGLKHQDTMAIAIGVKSRKSELEKLKKRAEGADLSVTEFIREYIESLS